MNLYCLTHEGGYVNPEVQIEKFGKIVSFHIHTVREMDLGYTYLQVCGCVTLG